MIPAMNKGGITDSEMENILDKLVDSLFSLFATLGMLMRPNYKLNNMLLEILYFFYFRNCSHYS